MLKIASKTELLENKEINEIFDEISKKVHTAINKSKKRISCNYGGKEIILDKKTEIKDFLMAKEFYKYDFNKEENEFVKDFIHLHNSTTYEILSKYKNTKSEKTQEFIEKYKGVKEFEEIKKVLKEGKKSLKDIKSEMKGSVNNIIDECFKYKFITSEQRHRLMYLIGLRVCPYCNMNYIVNYEHLGEKKSTADLDHFYSQSTYPEYSLCLFNFIPSCPICNSRFKLQSKMNVNEHIYPYEDGFEGKAKFKISNVVEALVNEEKPAITLDIYNDDESKKVLNSSNIFKTEELYETMSNYAEELLMKSEIYNEQYIEQLFENNKELFKSTKEVKKLIFGEPLSEDEMLNISLGKLKMDLLKQIKIYDK